MIPVIVVALLEETAEGDVIAAALFAIAALTDGLDGYIARRQRQETTFGKLMDPLADKLLVTAALVSLVSLDRLAAWVAMVIIAREFAVTGLRSVAAERGVVISASWLGKAKTGLQVAAIFGLIAFEPTAGGRGHPGLRGGGDDRHLGRRLLPRPAAPHGCCGGGFACAEPRRRSPSRKSPTRRRARAGLRAGLGARPARATRAARRGGGSGFRSRPLRGPRRRGRCARRRPCGGGSSRGSPGGRP